MCIDLFLKSDPGDVLHVTLQHTTLPSQPDKINRDFPLLISRCDETFGVGCDHLQIQASGR